MVYILILKLLLFKILLTDLTFIVDNIVQHQFNLSFLLMKLILTWIGHKGGAMNPRLCL